MNSSSPAGGRSRPRPPIDAARLEALALRYVGRYATSRAKLAAYLRRKLAERGWADEGGKPDVAALVERLAGLGYVDDRAFADARASALLRRGFGVRRVAAALDAAGIEADDSSDARRDAAAGARDAALAYARRKRIGPFARVPPDRAAREKAIASMIRAGHDIALAREIAGAAPDRDDDGAGQAGG